MMSSADHWQQQEFLARWNPMASADKMEKVLMEWLYTSLEKWTSSNLAAWDATCSDTFAPSHSSLASNRAAGVADQVEACEAVQYSQSSRNQPYFCSCLHWIYRGLWNRGSRLPEADLDFAAHEGEVQSLQFLIQRLSVTACMFKEAMPLISGNC